MTLELQIAMSLSAGFGVTLLLVSVWLSRRRQRSVASRLSTVVGAIETMGGARQVADPEDDQQWSRRPWAAVQVDRLLVASGIGRWLQGRIASAGLEVTAAEYLLIDLVLGAGLASALLLTTRYLPLAIVGGLGGLYLPWWYLQARHRRRREEFSLQLADTVAVLVSALRAGLSLTQALERASAESREPTSGELRRVVREVKMGLPVGFALQNLAVRIQSRDMDLLVAALEVQRDIGGDIASLMAAMNDTMRERLRIKAEVRVITAQQRMAAQVMFVMPVAISVLLYLLNPSYVLQLFSSERLLCGLPVFFMPMAAVLLLTAGYFAVRQVASIEM